MKKLILRWLGLEREITNMKTKMQIDRDKITADLPYMMSKDFLFKH